jgi:hypothetical protein
MGLWPVEYRRSSRVAPRSGRFLSRCDDLARTEYVLSVETKRNSQAFCLIRGVDILSAQMSSLQARSTRQAECLSYGLKIAGNFSR